MLTLLSQPCQQQRRQCKEDGCAQTSQRRVSQQARAPAVADHWRSFCRLLIDETISPFVRGQRRRTSVKAERKRRGSTTSAREGSATASRAAAVAALLAATSSSGQSTNSANSSPASAARRRKGKAKGDDGAKSKGDDGGRTKKGDDGAKTKGDDGSKKRDVKRHSSGTKKGRGRRQSL